MRIRRPVTLFAAMAGFALMAASGGTASAQATRTWVSGVGDDAKSVQPDGAVQDLRRRDLETAAGGEISVLDPGGFGAVTITKSISIVADGNEGSIVASLVNGININAGVNDQVTIHGLKLEGFGNGLNGINVLGAGAVYISRVFIRGFRGSAGCGINVAPTAHPTRVYVNNSEMVANKVGVCVTSLNAAQPAAVALDDVVIENNSVNSVSINGGTAGMSLHNSRLSQTPVLLQNGGALSSHSNNFIAGAVGPTSTVPLKWPRTDRRGNTGYEDQAIGHTFDRDGGLRPHGHLRGGHGLGAGHADLGLGRRRRRESVQPHGAMQDVRRGHLETAAGGEISVLDPGGFGTVTITKSISIVADGSEGSILAAATNGININAGPTDQVTIHGLKIEGAQTGLVGIRVLQAGAVYISHTFIRGFKAGAACGVNVIPTANPVRIYMNKSEIVGNNTGICVTSPTASQAAAVALDDVVIENNSANSVSLNGASAGMSLHNARLSQTPVSLVGGASLNSHGNNFIAGAVGPTSTVPLK